MQAEGVEDLVTPRKGGLICELALLCAFFERGTGNSQFDEFGPCGSIFSGPLERRAGGSHKATAAGFTIKALRPISKTAFRNIPLITFGLAVRTIGLFCINMFSYQVRALIALFGIGFVGVVHQT